MKGDWIICYECNSVYPGTSKYHFEDYIDVCPMDTADEELEVGYYCPHCGYFVIRCFADEI